MFHGILLRSRTSRHADPGSGAKRAAEAGSNDERGTYLDGHASQPKQRPAAADPGSRERLESPSGGARRTLRGRVSLFGLIVIAAWLLVLTVAFNLVLVNRLNSALTAALANRVDSVAATVQVSRKGAVSVIDSKRDGALDAGVWIYQGHHAIERPSGSADIQHVADSLAGTGRRFADNLDQQRLLALPLYDGKMQVGTVVAAIQLAPYRRPAQTALWGSVVLAVCLLAGAYPVLRMTTARALSPVDRMAAQAAEWSANDLGQRFGRNQQRFQELQTLAHHLDGVLDRLAAVVRHERQLPAELSHELRTPLSRVSAEADLLLARPRTNEERLRAYRSIQEATATMQHILDSLLSAARAGLIDAPGRCAVAQVLGKFSRDVQWDSTMDVEVQPADLAAGVEDVVLERIVSPIIDNARRHAFSQVRITAGKSVSGLTIDIADDGPGVPPALREAIFEPGYRGDKGDGHDGAGLGLALARRLARASDGDVTVVELATSSAFRLQLPSG